jgi:hypothetical protein
MKIRCEELAIQKKIYGLLILISKECISNQRTFQNHNSKSLVAHKESGGISPRAAAQYITPTPHFW